MLGRRRQRLSLALVLALSAASPHRSDATEHEFTGEGWVVALNAQDGVIVVEHGGIPGLAAASRTEFPVANTALLRDVRLGDRVAFTLAPRGDRHGMLTITALRTVETERPGGVGRAGLLEWPVVLVPVTGALLLGVGLFLQGERTRRTVQRQGHDIRAALTEQLVLLRQTLSAVEPVEQAFLAIVNRLQADVRRLAEEAHLPSEGPSAAAAESNRAEALPLVVVRRAEMETYRLLQERLGESGRVRIIWDRRRSERRSVGGRPVVDRRRGERRMPTSVTWDSLGYLVVDRPSRHLTVVA